MDDIIKFVTENEYFVTEFTSRFTNNYRNLRETSSIDKATYDKLSRGKYKKWIADFNVVPDDKTPDRKELVLVDIIDDIKRTRFTVSGDNKYNITIGDYKTYIMKMNKYEHESKEVSINGYIVKNTVHGTYSFILKYTKDGGFESLIIGPNKDRNTYMRDVVKIMKELSIYNGYNFVGERSLLDIIKK